MPALAPGASSAHDALAGGTSAGGVVSSAMTADGSTPPDAIQKQAERLAEGDFFQDEIFTDLDLPAADLTEKEFQRCVFRRCKLPESRLAGSKLEDCLFEGCDLNRMLPEKLSLRGVIFRGSRLMGVDWTGLGPLPVVTFEECDLRYASFLKLRLPNTRWLRCTAREASFLEVELANCDFAGSDLTGSTIVGCSLLKADFSQARGVLFDPTRNKTKGARISIESAVLILQSYGIVVADFD
jgi:uncharacterized protein YjbI with pentapeptide repeats